MRNRSVRRFNKEKISMIVSSLLIVTACTLTGVYINGKEREAAKENVVDFAALEDEEPLESVENTGRSEVSVPQAPMEKVADTKAAAAPNGMDQDLDADPFYQEANSSSIINPFMSNNATDTEQKEPTDDEQKNAEGQSASDEQKTDDGATDDKETDNKENSVGEASQNSGEQKSEEKKEDTAAEETMAGSTAGFSETGKLSWPITGKILMNYSMDRTIHFATLDQYKYNPALIIQGEVNANVKSPAAGTITAVGQDAEIGQYVVMDLGNGFELTLGQLANLKVQEGSQVTGGQVLGAVSEPSKYYSVEGSNLYVALKKDGKSINPMDFLPE